MLSDTQLEAFHNSGYLVLDKLFGIDQMESLKASAMQIVEQFDPDSTREVFSTTDQSKTRNQYFLSSGDKVCCFFEEQAFTHDGQLKQDKSLSINKIGHALHRLVPEFNAFSLDPKIKQLAVELGLAKPEIRQSMYIFKQPRIGGEIRWHQDATYFYTQPLALLTFWFAVEDANIVNGCLQVQAEGPAFPLKERFIRHSDDTTELNTLDEMEWPTLAEAKPIEVKKGSLVIFNGLLPHFSAPNQSNKSRHAFTLHITCGTTHYAKENWLQAAPYLL
jgi:phytanoyl-CoA hydroxylase